MGGLTLRDVVGVLLQHGKRGGRCEWNEARGVYWFQGKLQLWRPFLVDAANASPAPRLSSAQEPTLEHTCIFMSCLSRKQERLYTICMVQRACNDGVYETKRHED